MGEMCGIGLVKMQCHDLLVLNRSILCPNGEADLLIMMRS